MTPAEVMEICDRIYKAFLTPRFIIRHLSRWRGLEDVLFSFKGFYAAVGHIRDFKREQ
jgi:hypothetical protein